MPVSDGDGKPWSLHHYTAYRPATVLDVGPGVGTYADLFRRHHEGHWTAVEVWAPYVTEHRLEDKYDRVIIADARHVNPDLFGVDLVIAGDVLEHLPHTDALNLIDTIRAHARALLVSVPLLHIDQGPVNGNPFETHLYHWTSQQMTDLLGPDSYQGPVLGCWWWEA